MDDKNESGDGPLQEVDTYSGKLYWLNPPSGKGIDFENLKDELQDRTFQENISEEFDLSDLVVPEVFEIDGSMMRTTTTEGVEIVSYDGHEIIAGKVVLDNVDKITYRDQEILVLDTTTAQFMIFKQNDFHYLCVLGNRELAKTVINILRDDFPALGSMINNTRLGADAISNIRDSLDAVLMDTIITDYDQTEITQTRIQGEAYERTKVYDQLGTGGKVKSHLFQTDVLVPDDTKTVLVGRDGLVRIYSNAILQTYLLLLKDHVIPEVHRDVESSPSVAAWGEATSGGSKSIFKDST